MKCLTEKGAWKDFWDKKGKVRPPLSSLKELSKELNVPIQKLVYNLRLEGSPKPILNSKQGHWCKKASYYNPKEFKEWWAKINDS